MNFLKQYRHFLTSGISVFGLLFIFQNGTCARVESQKKITSAGGYIASGSLALGPQSVTIAPNATVYITMEPQSSADTSLS